MMEIWLVYSKHPPKVLKFREQMRKEKYKARNGFETWKGMVKRKGISCDYIMSAS
jgi:hypothetical protein